MPDLAAGRRFCSLAFSHLRGPGPPILRVRPDGDEWVFDGTAPWMTGWGLADEVLLAGVLPDGRSAWALAPLAEGEALRASPPVRLCRHERLGHGRTRVPRPLGCGSGRQVKTMTPAELGADTAGANLFFTVLSLGVTLAAIESCPGPGAPTPCPRPPRPCLDRELAVGAGGGRWLGRPGDVDGASSG